MNKRRQKKKNRQDNRKLRLNIRPSILIWVLRNGRKNNSAQRNGIDVKLSKERKKINKSQALTICNTSNNLTLSSCLPTFRAPAIVGVEEEEEKKKSIISLAICFLPLYCYRTLRVTSRGVIKPLSEALEYY